MTISVVFETHSITVDNEAGRATGWLPGELSDLAAEESFGWREGWEYVLG